LAADIEDLWEPWMRLVDGLLEDEQLLDTIYEAQGERYPQSRRITSVFVSRTQTCTTGC
jgi:hypothetical protein